MHSINRLTRLPGAKIKTGSPRSKYRRINHESNYLSPPPPPPPGLSFLLSSAFKKLTLAAIALLFTAQLALAEPGVSLGTSQSTMGGSSLTLQLTCGLKGHRPTQYQVVRSGCGGDRQPDCGTSGGAVEYVNTAAAYFYVKGTGIGRATDDGDFEPLPAGHPGRAWGAKRWGDLWGARMQPRYEVDIALTLTPQPEPPVYFVTGTSLQDGRHQGSPVENQTVTVQRRYDTTLFNQKVSLVRYCALDSKETISVTINGSIAGKRPL